MVLSVLGNAIEKSTHHHKVPDNFNHHVIEKKNVVRFMEQYNIFSTDLLYFKIHNPYALTSCHDIFIFERRRRL